MAFWSSEEEINDKDWSCLVALMCESGPKYTTYVKMFQKALAADEQSVIVNITPKMFERQKSRSLSVTEASYRMAGVALGGIKVRSKSPTKRSTKNSPAEDKEQCRLLALQIRDFIVDFKKENMKNIYSLRKRGVFSRDESSEHPIPGPHVYFVLNDFQNADLIPELCSHKVPLIPVISIGSIDSVENVKQLSLNARRNSSKFARESKSPFLKNAQSARKSEDMRVNRRNSKQAVRSEKQKEKQGSNIFKIFWQKFNDLLQDRKNKDLLKNVIKIIVDPPTVIGTIETKQSSKLLYAYITKILFDTVIHMRNHIHYINNINCIQIPTEKPSGIPLFYHSLLDQLPPEFITIEYILNCIVDQICYTESSEADLMIHSEEEISLDNSTVSENTIQDLKLCQPLLFNHRDLAGINTFHLDIPGINFNKISGNIYLNMPYSNLWKYFPRKNELEVLRLNSHLYKMWKTRDSNISFKLFKTYIHQILFLKLYFTIYCNEENIDGNIKSLNKILDVILAGPVKGDRSENEKLDAQEWEDYYEKEADKIKQFLQCKEITSLFGFRTEAMHILNFNSVETMPTEILLQSLQESYSNFYNIYFDHYAPTDKVILWFENGFNLKAPIDRTFKTVLKTVVPFREFYKRIRHKERAWLKSQINTILTENDNYQIDYLKNLESPKYRQVLSDEEYLYENVQLPLPPMKIGQGKYHNVYDIGNSIYETSESVTNFCSVDGPRVSLKRIHSLEETSYMYIVLNSFGTDIISYRPLNYNCLNDKIHMSIETKNGIRFSYSLDSSDNKIGLSTSNAAFQSGKIVNDLNDIVNDFNITLPTGLQISFISREGETCVRQKYIQNDTYFNRINNECQRIYLANGTVLIYRENDEIHALYPNSDKLEVIDMEYNVKDLSQVTQQKVIHEPSHQDKYKLKNTNKEGPPTKGTQSPKNNRLKVKFETKNVISENSSLFADSSKGKYELTAFKETKWNGKCTNFEKEKEPEVYQLYSLRVANDPGNELYIKRSDGTNTLFKNDGTLHVKYEDGTLITTVVHEIHKDLNEEVQSDMKSNTISVMPDIYHTEEESEIGDIEVIENQYVIFEIEHIVEHPSYARVQNKNGIFKLTLPDDLHIYKSETDYKLILKGKSEVNINKYCTYVNSQRDSQKLTINNGTVSMFHFMQFNDGERYEIFSCKDSIGRVFSAYSDGTTAFNYPETINIDYNNLMQKNILFSNKYYVISRDMTGYELLYEPEDNAESMNLLSSSSLINDSQCGSSNQYSFNSSCEMKDEILNSTSSIDSTVSLTYSPIYLTSDQKFYIPYFHSNHKPERLQRKHLSGIIFPEINWLFDLNLKDKNFKASETWSFISEKSTKSNRSVQPAKENPIAFLYRKINKITEDVNFHVIYQNAFKNYLALHNTIQKKYLQYLKIYNSSIFANIEIPKTSIDVNKLIKNEYFNEEKKQE